MTLDNLFMDKMIVNFSVLSTSMADKGDRHVTFMQKLIQL